MLRRHHRALFFFTWLALNLIQAGGTELFDDEAYYWVYSRWPAWGYFDHPPMIAILIRPGYFFFHNEFGVRLFILCCSTATLYIIGQLIPRRNDLLFYAIVCGIAVMQLGGIIAVPDIPLLLFASLFFLVYRRWLQNMSIWNTALLGLIIALLCYSKYHGFLILFFTLLSYPRLLTKRSTWLAAGIALLLFSPHLYWQYLHGFPSVQYHLSERNADHYLPGFTLEYLLGQLLLAGPLAGPVLLWAAFSYRPKDPMEKALKYTMAGFYTFFLFITLRGRVEANWTVPALIGLVVLSHQYLQENTRSRIWIFRLAPVTLALVMVVRVYMLLDLNPSALIVKDEFHGNRRWVEAIRKQSKGGPVVFLDSYQKPSKYWFYSGIPAMSLNTPGYRRNNFNFWPLEDSFLGKRVYVIGPYDKDVLNEKIQARGWEYDGGKMIDPYFSFSRIGIQESGTPPLSSAFSVRAKIHAPADFLPLFRQAPFDTVSVELGIFLNDSLLRYFPAGLRLREIRGPVSCWRPILPSSLPGGEYTLRYAISSCIPGQPSLNSRSILLNVP